MRRAFVMGSNGSQNLSPLKYALEDAKRIKACLESPRCGFEVTLLESETDPFEIRRSLYNIAESCTPQDTFICYFAGHGILERGSLFLFLDKTEIGRLGTTSIPISEVLQAFQYCNWVTDLTPSQFSETATQLPLSRIWDFAALGSVFRTSNPATWLTQSQEIHHDSTSPAPIDLTGARWNDRGISDMFGNVWEWCSLNDSEGVFHPATSNVVFKSYEEDSGVELRGGGFLDNLTNIEPFLPAYRLVNGRNTRHSDLGFRTAISVDVKILPDDIKLRLSLCKKLSDHTVMFFPSPILSSSFVGLKQKWIIWFYIAHLVADRSEKSLIE